MRKNKKKDIISKRRQNLALNQILKEGAGFWKNMDMRTPHNNRSIRLTNTLITNNE